MFVIYFIELIAETDYIFFALYLLELNGVHNFQQAGEMAVQIKVDNISEIAKIYFSHSTLDPRAFMSLTLREIIQWDTLASLNVGKNRSLSDKSNFYVFNSSSLW